MIKKQINLDELYTEYYQKVFSYIYSRIQNYYEAQDISEDVFVKVVNKIDSFDESKSSISTWIFNITKNTLIDYYRKRHDDYELLDNYDYLQEEPEISKTELTDLSLALEKLDEEERTIIVLRYYDGYSLKEIAKKMSLSYGITKLRHNKALDDLKKLLTQ